MEVLEITSYANTVKRQKEEPMNEHYPRDMRTIWQEIAKIVRKGVQDNWKKNYDKWEKKALKTYSITKRVTKDRQMLLWSLQPKNKPIWIDTPSWYELMEKNGTNDDEDGFWPNPHLKDTDGYERYTIDDGPPDWGGHARVQEFQFTMDTREEKAKNEEEEYQRGYWIGSWDMIRMPYNCGMLCLSDVRRDGNLKKLGIGSLLVEYAEAYCQMKNYHAIIGTGVAYDFKNREPIHDDKWKRSREKPIIKICEARGWERAGEFYNHNSGNVVATYQKEFNPK
jgi:GNAT superfamily N-acetyltransferase